MKKSIDELIENYFMSKDIAERNCILKYLVCNLPADAKEFFLRAFKKERYLDMKLCAVRGYAEYADISEVEALMDKLLALLKKIPDKTPYDYQEYEAMRSDFLMPYLIKKYNYDCFKTFSMQLEKQYDDMPDCFKNIYTLDSEGNLITIRDPAEVSQSLTDFFSNNKHS